jgi:hypothetical protein
MRRCIRLRRVFGIGYRWKFLIVYQKGRSDPEGVVNVVPSWVDRIGVNEDAQAAMIEHQPGHQRCKELLGKGDLEHRAIMRADADVMPAAKLYRKALTNPGAQPFGGRAGGRRIIIDVSMIARDFGYRPWGGRSLIHGGAIVVRPDLMRTYQSGRINAFGFAGSANNKSVSKSVGRKRHAFYSSAFIIETAR